MDKGLLYSGVGHFGLILWVTIGGFFIRHDDAMDMAVTEVSLMTSAEFDAMQAARPTSPAPEAPQAEAETPVEEDAPTPPVAEPPPAPPPEVAPEVVETAPEAVPEMPQEETPPSPVISEEPPILAPVNSARPQPRPAPRVAPVPTETPAPDAVVDATPTPAVTPEAAPEAQVVEEAKPEAAPEAAGTVLETEANKAEPLAPSSSSRPRPRPARRAETAPVEQAAPETTSSTRDAIAEAVAAAAAATSETSTSQATAPAGPPMTAGEKDGLRVAVQACWNVGSLSSDALRVTVTVAVDLGQDGKPDVGSLTMTNYEGGSDGAARQAFEAARRAIIRCGANGFKLPPEKYEQWRSLELVFNPDGMRMK